MKIIITAKFRGSRRLRFEDTKGIMSPEKFRDFRETGPRGPFLESPGNLTGPKSYFEISVLRKVRCALTYNEVHFVCLADNLNV